MSDSSSDVTGVDHLDPEVAANYTANLLEPLELAQVEAHIDACRPCRELLSAVAKSAWSSIGGSFGVTAPASKAGGEILPRGTRVGPFEIEEPLGAGGMGVVYLAYDGRLDRQVALKCVRDRAAAKEQLLKEAKLMAQLAHPNVVPVYDVLDSQGQTFIAMELVPGRTLKQWLDSKPRTWQHIVDLFLEAGQGIAAAHEAGIIHGDVKPGNILVGNDTRVRVTDFGLASLGVEDNGELRGTPAYLAPEQLKGQPCDQKCDQYSFAVSLFEALFGSLPGQPPTRKTTVPRGVRKVVERGLSADPSSRFSTLQALVLALRGARLAQWRFVVAGAVTTMLFVTFSFAVGGQRATTAQCEAAAGELSAPWTAEVKANAREAFQRPQVSYGEETFARVEKSLDGWQRSFDTVRSSVCAGKVFSRGAAPNLPRQLACLKDNALEARALVTQLLDADVGVLLHAVAAAQALTPPERCLEDTRDDVAFSQSPAARSVNERIARARAIAASGKYTDALPAAQEAAKAADESGDLRLRALAQTVLGGIQGLVGDYDTGAVTLAEAIRLAEQSHEDRARALAWSDVVMADYARGQHDRVIALSPIALGACERINDVRLQTEVLGTLGASLSEKGKNAEAKKLIEEAVALRVKAYGEKDRRTSAMLSVLANAMAMSGDLAGATEAHRRALEAAEVAFGPAHPEVSVIRQNLGDDYLYGLKVDASIPVLVQAVEALRAAMGPKSRSAALAEVDLGFAYLWSSQHALATTTFESAIGVFESSYPKHPTFAMALLGRHQAGLAQGQPARVSDLEKALELGGELPPFELGRVQLALGLALPETSPRAKELVSAAKKNLEVVELPLIVKEREKALEWLAAHP